MRGLNRTTLPILFFLLFLALMPYYYFWAYPPITPLPPSIDLDVAPFNASDSHDVIAPRDSNPTNNNMKDNTETPKADSDPLPIDTPIDTPTEAPTAAPTGPSTEAPTDTPKDTPTNPETNALPSSDSVSLENSTTTSPPTTKYKLVIGIASMRRGPRDKPRSTLVNTLKYVIPKITPEERLTTRVIVFNLNDPPEDHDQIKEVEETYHDDIKEGFVQVVTNWEGYGDLLNPNMIERTHNDSIGRILWRSKENLDFAYIIDYCSKLGEFVLFLEDDVKAANNFISKAMRYFDEPPLSSMDTWLFFSLYTPYPHIKDKQPYPFGCCTQAIIFQATDLPDLTRYIRERYAKDPVDWILRDYLESSKKHMCIIFCMVVRVCRSKTMGTFSYEPKGKL